jgi:ribosome maturation factor RimP
VGLYFLPRPSLSGRAERRKGLGEWAAGPFFVPMPFEGAVVHSALKERLIKLLEPPLRAMGYELVDVEARAGRNGLLRLYIDQDLGIKVDDCERVSRQIGTLLDVEEPLPGSYTLEVSSPGLDRPLRTMAHFERFAGHEAKIRLIGSVEGRRNFKGRLCGVEGTSIVVEVDGQKWHLPLADVATANLVAEF